MMYDVRWTQKERTDYKREKKEHDYLPTKEQIAKETQRLKATWDQRKRERRAVGLVNKTAIFELPVCDPLWSEGITVEELENLIAHGD